MLSPITISAIGSTELKDSESLLLIRFNSFSLLGVLTVGIPTKAYGYLI